MEHEKDRGDQKKEEGKEGHEGHYGGLFIGKRSLWLMAGGALGTLAALGMGKATRKVRPAVVCAVKEGYAFKEWVAGQYDQVKEDIEDIVAEAVYEYQKDLATTADSVKREKELLERIEKLVEARLAKMQPAKKEG